VTFSHFSHFLSILMPKAIFTYEQVLLIQKELKSAFYQNDQELAALLQKKKDFKDFNLEQLKYKLVRVRGAMRKSGDVLNAPRSKKNSKSSDVTEPATKKQKKIPSGIYISLFDFK